MSVFTYYPITSAHCQNKFLWQCLKVFQNFNCNKHGIGKNTYGKAVQDEAMCLV